MSDYEALLAAVLETPEDNLPRLVLADWLEETGRPESVARAHFIRAQIEAESHPLGSPERHRLDALANRLHDSFSHVWRYELPDWLEQDRLQLNERQRVGIAFGYRRGFVEDVRLPIDVLRERGRELFEVAPVQTVRIFGYVSNHPAGWFGTLPRLAQVATLQFEFVPLTAFGGVTVEPQELHEPTLFRDLMSAPTLKRVRHLILSDLHLTDLWLQQFIRRLPEAAFAESLAELDLSLNQLTDSSAWLMVTSRPFQQVTRLNVASNRMSMDARRVLRNRFGDGLIDE